MDGRAFDNIFIERLWRTVKYEEVYLRDYESVPHATDSLAAYFAFYNRYRTHLPLEMDSPATRPVRTPDQGGVLSVPLVGGLHHRYERCAA